MSDEIGSFTLGDAAPILEFWKEFDLDTKRLDLDQTCVEMREMKTASISGRKKLNDATKAFRTKSKEEQQSVVTELLKLYQDEIDQLSRRSKFSETAFSGIYKALFEAPNPVIAMDGLISLVTSASTHQLEVQRLKNELAQYDEEFQQLKNQDITIRRLEEQLAEYRDQIEDKVIEEVSKRSEEAEQAAEVKIGESKEIQRAMEKRLQVAVESMRQAQAQADRAQTQLFEVSSQAENRLSALSAENSILAEGSDRLQSRIAETEGELESLRGTLAAAQQQQQTRSSTHSSSSSNSSGNLNALVDSSGKSISGETAETLELVIAELRQDIRKKEESFRSEKQRLEAAHRDIQQQLSKDRELLGRAKQELAERPTREDLISIRRQLKMLQRVAFNVQDQDDEEDGEEDAFADPENTKPLGEKAQLEVLLTARMKSLESDLAETRRDLLDTRKQEVAARESAATLRASLEASNTLITRLEADLDLQIEHAKLGKKGSSGSYMDSTRELSELLGVDMSASSAPSLYASSQTTVTAIGTTATAASDSSLLSTNATGPGAGATAHATTTAGNTTGTVEVASSSSTTGTGNSNSNSTHDSSSQMISVLQGQRDRYKDRLTQIESSLRQTQQQLITVQNAKTQLEQDNLALYAKIRYLQSSGTGSHTAKIPYSPKAMKINRNAHPSSSRGRYPGRDPSSSSYSEETIGDEESGGGHNRGGGGGGGGRGGGFKGGSEGSNEDGDDADMELRYRAMYEQKMNPFAEFSQLEKQRRVQELSVADRIVLNTTIAFVSTHAGRRVLVAYMAIMHLMVFGILYYNAHHVHYGCDPTLDHLHKGGMVAGHIN